MQHTTCAPQPMPPRRERRRRKPTSAPTLDEIRSWPAAVDLARAATAYDMSRSKAYELAAQGRFPARVLQIGGRYRVVTASIIAVLEEGAPA